jgi:hypothetical protein
VDKLESEQAAKDNLGISIGDNSTETSIKELNNLRIILISSLRLYKVIDYKSHNGPGEGYNG